MKGFRVVAIVPWQTKRMLSIISAYGPVDRKRLSLLRVKV